MNSYYLIDKIIFVVMFLIAQCERGAAVAGKYWETRRRYAAYGQCLLEFPTHKVTKQSRRQLNEKYINKAKALLVI